MYHDTSDLNLDLPASPEAEWKCRVRQAEARSGAGAGRRAAAAAADIRVHAAGVPQRLELRRRAAAERLGLCRGVRPARQVWHRGARAVWRER